MIRSILKVIALKFKAQFLIWRCNRLIRKRDRLVNKGHYYRASDVNHQMDILIKRCKTYVDELKSITKTEES